MGNQLAVAFLKNDPAPIGLTPGVFFPSPNNGSQFYYRNFTDGYTCNDDAGCGPQSLGRCYMWPDGTRACVLPLQMNETCRRFESNTDPLRTYLNEPLRFSGLCDRTTSYCGKNGVCVPLLKPGDTCDPHGMRCGGGTTCISSKCMPFPKDGETCVYDEQCPSGPCGASFRGKTCQAVQSSREVSGPMCGIQGLTCEGQGFLNAICRKNPNMPNAPGICIKYTIDPCSKDGVCTDKTYCDVNPTKRTCNDRLRRDAMCDRNRMCADGLVCSVDFKCANPGAMGVACARNDQCASQSCVSNKCAEGGGTGAACEKGDQCVSRNCVSNKCAETRGTGAVCEKDDQCVSQSCVSNKCVENRGIGAVCNMNEQCASRGCSQNVCVRMGTPQDEEREGQFVEEKEVYEELTEEEFNEKRDE